MLPFFINKKYTMSRDEINKELLLLTKRAHFLARGILEEKRRYLTDKPFFLWRKSLRNQVIEINEILDLMDEQEEVWKRMTIKMP